MTTTAKLPERIRASISPDAMRKVTRFFSADLGDIFLELFQNARRAGATRVDVRTVPNIAAGRTQVTVTDDGRGIADPATVLAFGESQWSEATTQSEDPAGMGVYSFAQKGAEIVTILDALAKAGVAFVALKESIRIEGKRALFAEVERDLISERTREGLARARSSGRKLGRPKGSLGVSRLDGKQDEIRGHQRSVSGRKPHEQRYVHVSSNSDRGGTKTTWASRPRVSSTR